MRIGRGVKNSNARAAGWGGAGRGTIKTRFPRPASRPPAASARRVADGERSAGLEERSPDRDERSPSVDERSSSRDERSPSLGERSPSLDERSPRPDERSASVEERSPRPEERSRSRERRPPALEVRRAGRGATGRGTPRPVLSFRRQGTGLRVRRPVAPGDYSSDSSSPDSRCRRASSRSVTRSIRASRLATGPSRASDESSRRNSAISRLRSSRRSVGIS
jgi:hypothetical protein